MRKVRVKALRCSLKEIISQQTKQQWRRWKENYMKGLI